MLLLVTWPRVDEAGGRAPGLGRHQGQARWPGPVRETAAYAGHVAGGFVYTDQTVATLCRLFDSLRAECYRASESAALIERTCRQWATGVSPLTAEPTAETA